MGEILALVIFFTLLHLIPIIDEKYKEPTIREKKTIDGFNEYETELIKRFKAHIEDRERSFSIENNVVSFHMPTEIDSVDLDRVRMYINMHLNTKFLVEDITVKYNKIYTRVNWYVIKFSRKYN